eukprot:1161349-Pelagomonas_calceolata.AAC.1
MPELLHLAACKVFGRNDHYFSKNELLPIPECMGCCTCWHAKQLTEMPSVGRNACCCPWLVQDIEDFLERPVFLELSVQCSEKWRDSKDMLRKYGYFDPAYV